MPVEALTATTTCGCTVRFDWPADTATADYGIVRLTITITLMPEPAA